MLPYCTRTVILAASVFGTNVPEGPRSPAFATVTDTVYEPSPQNGRPRLIGWHLVQPVVIENIVVIGPGFTAIATVRVGKGMQPNLFHIRFSDGHGLGLDHRIGAVGGGVVHHQTAPRRRRCR